MYSYGSTITNNHYQHILFRQEALIDVAGTFIIFSFFQKILFLSWFYYRGGHGALIRSM